MLEYDKINISEGVDVNKKNYRKNAMFVTIVILKVLVLSMRSIFAMVDMI